MMTIPMVFIGAYDSHSNMLNIDSVAWAYQTVQYPACLKINYTLGEAAGYPGMQCAALWPRAAFAARLALCDNDT
jgi:hypothetical protein